MAKLEREALFTYIDAGMHTALAGITTESPANWELIGDDIEDMSNALNPDTSQFKNILGQTKTTDRGYQPSMDATPYYADPDKALYTHIRDIAMQRLKGDACKTLMLEVIVEDDAATSHTAYVQEVVVKPQSYGGNTDGLNFPFNVLEDGQRIAGTVTAASMTAGAPVFTAAS